MNRILVTGSSGFVGESLVRQLLKQKNTVIAHSRSAQLPECENVHSQISSTTDWSDVLADVDVIVHCAARVHQMSESAQDAQKAYDAVNVSGTLNLARQAVAGGVKRFIFISSIKVNGEYTEIGKPFTSEVVSEPEDPYGKSKYQAEQGLIQLAQDTGLELVIIRPPLIYGPGVKANFLSMMNLVKKKLPLPLGAIKSQRSLVFLDNLVDLIGVCCTHSNAPGHTFLVSDDYDVSVTHLLNSIAKAMDVRSCLMPIPQSMLASGLTLIGKKQVAQRLCSSLQLEISETKKILNWTPPYSFDAGIQKTVQAYLKENNL